jgi:hypothetical protein
MSQVIADARTHELCIRASVIDADVQVLDEQQDVGSGEGPADADVVQRPLTRGVTQPALPILSVRSPSWVPRGLGPEAPA